MKAENKLNERKPTRLREYNYSSAGAYFITICIQNRKRILSDIVCTNVGDGAHDVPQTQLTPIGKIVENNLLSSENIPGVKIGQYVIMPDHIHAIIILDPSKYANRKHGTSKAPSPTNEMLPHIISSFKRFCSKGIGNNVFQRGYIEHIIRDRADYETKIKYIYENPTRWYYKELQAEINNHLL